MKIFIYLLILTMTIGCSNNKNLENLPSNSKILAFGDSLTFGYGVTSEESYPKQLEKIINYEVINAGLNGDTARNGRYRLKNLIEEYHPSLVILGLGGNDMLRNYKHDLSDNLEEMIVYLKSKNVIVVLLATPEPSIMAMSIGLSDATIYKVLAKKHNVILFDNIYSKYLSDNKYKSDLIHLNAIGYKLVAEDIAKQLKKHNLITEQ